MFILASSSPRRKELLRQIIKDFEIHPVDIDESESYSLPPEEANIDIAIRKANKAKEEYPSDISLSADTIVIIDQKIIGKPLDKTDAIRILKTLSGRTHEVITTYVINTPSNHIVRSVRSYVTFNALSDDFIIKYVNEKNPLDKAGAYGLQDDDDYHLIKKVEGSISNVIGLPLEELKRDLEKLKIL